MGLQCGIVGLPNVGKSTLFNAVTKAEAEAANYPFCTIDPNVGVVAVPDTRLDEITKRIKPKTTIPTAIEFVDIAGLVAGASKGEGLGNQFLSHIREVDAILHVIRCFDDENVVHVAGSVDPLRDADIINMELMLADMDTVDRRHSRVFKLVRSTNDKNLKIEAGALDKLKKALDSGAPARSVQFDELEVPIVTGLHLLTFKPVMYVCNVDEAGFSEGNSWSKQVEELAAKEGQSSIRICSSIEAEISQLDPEEQIEFLESLGTEEPGLNRLIRQAYDLLGLQTYFTAGEKEVRAWTIRQGTLAPQAAGVIHSDFERGFIRAETYHFEDLVELGSESAIKDAGKYRSEGKEYLVKDGDVLLFRFNV